MTIYERFLALPRARKGGTAVVIVEEDVLRKLIYDATWKHPEVSEQFRASKVENSLTTITGGAAGGPPMQIHVDPPAGPPPTLLARVFEDERRRRGW